MKITLFLLVLCPVFMMAQTLTSVEPDSAVAGSSINLTISGNNTSFLQGSNTVWFSQGTMVIDADYVMSVTNEKIEANFHFENTAPTGLYDLNVENSDDGHMMLNDAFTLYIASSNATLNSIYPNSVTLGDYASFTITGTDTHFEQGSPTSVWFSKDDEYIYTDNTYAVNDETLAVFDCHFPFDKPTGVYDVHTYNFTDGMLTLTNALTVNTHPNPPELTNVSPKFISEGSGVQLTVTGNNTHFMQGSPTSVWFEQGTSTISTWAMDIIDDETIKIDDYYIDYYDQLGDYDLYTHNNIDGELSLSGAITLVSNADAPDLAGFMPGDIYQETHTNITITGSNTHFSQAANNTIKFVNGETVITTTNCYAEDNETLRVLNYNFGTDVPTGIYNVYTENSIDGTLEHDDAFTLHEPQDGIENHKNNRRLIAYPNPTKGKVSIDISGIQRNVILKIFNTNGKIIKQTEFNAAGQNKKTVDLSHFENGAYLFNLKTASTTKRRLILLSK